MDAKLKAKNLVDGFRLILIKSNTDAGEEILCTLLAKECALVAVDEIFGNNTDESKHDYWVDVKTEIEKL
jgi:hypothetical protein